MFASVAHAMGASGGAGGSDALMQFMPLILMLLIFYFLLIRPQQKKIKQHEAMLHSLKKGDKIITGGGILGTIVSTDEFEMEIEIAHNVRVKILRSSVRELAIDEALKRNPEAAKAKKAKADETVAMPHKTPANSN